MNDCSERRDAEKRKGSSEGMGMGEKEKQEVAMLTARFTEHKHLVYAEIGDGRIGNRSRMWLFSSGLSNSSDKFFWDKMIGGEDRVYIGKSCRQSHQAGPYLQQSSSYFCHLTVRGQSTTEMVDAQGHWQLTRNPRSYVVC